MTAVSPSDAASPTSKRPSAMPIVAASPACRPSRALRIARYPMLGPGVSSITIAAQDRQALDALLLHQGHDVLQQCILRNRHRLRRHHVLDDPSFLANVLGGLLARSDEEREPGGAAAAGADFAAADEIALGHDA